MWDTCLDRGSACAYASRIRFRRSRSAAAWRRRRCRRSGRPPCRPSWRSRSSECCCRSATARSSSCGCRPRRTSCCQGPRHRPESLDSRRRRAVAELATGAEEADALVGAGDHQVAAEGEVGALRELAVADLDRAAAELAEVGGMKVAGRVVGRAELGAFCRGGRLARATERGRRRRRKDAEIGADLALQAEPGAGAERRGSRGGMVSSGEAGHASSAHSPIALSRNRMRCITRPSLGSNYFP